MAIKPADVELSNPGPLTVGYEALASQEVQAHLGWAREIAISVLVQAPLAPAEQAALSCSHWEKVSAAYEAWK
jgi:hypothetical protein